MISTFKKTQTILLAFLVSIFFIQCNKSSKSLTQAQETIYYYLYNKSLISDTFSRIIYKSAIDFRGINLEENKMYFIFKKELGRAEMLQRVTLDTSDVEFAPCESGFCNFGGLQGNIDGYYAFKTSPANLKTDTRQVYRCNLDSFDFSVSFVELMKLRDEKITYNFPKQLYFTKNSQSANIGAYISKKGKDPIIIRLAEILTKNLKTNEEKAQALLNFVSSKITYSFEDYWYQSEITKRSHEILLSGQGDCSSKSILYASLLEQCDIPYCLLYFNRHVNVGVRGNFVSENNYYYQKKNERFFMAETTVPNFQLGKTLLENSEIISTILYYQEPQLSDEVINVNTNEIIKQVHPIEEE